MNSRFMAVACLTVAISVSGVLAARALAPEKFGAGVTISQVTPLDAVIKTPETFDGRTVRVEGVVTSVCEEMGCWMALGTKDAKGAPTMMIKVDDGVIVFPVSAKGKRAAAQGVVQRVGAMSHDPGHGAGAGHDADHDGVHGAPGGDHAAQEHAPSEHMASASQWQIKATGALIY